MYPTTVLKFPSRASDHFAYFVQQKSFLFMQVMNIHRTSLYFLQSIFTTSLDHSVTVNLKDF